jgi:hypothetical protein
METLMKYFNRKTILSIVLSTLLLNLSSQSNTDEDIHRKYWYYKSHLNNDFIKVGLGLGESIPFNEKITAHSNPAANLDLTDAPKLHAGDASARLGIYLSVLATEYRLLKNNNQDVTKVKHEIFCALNAINRLDRDAETYFDAPSPQNTPSLNGFFVRDDIRGNFVANNYKHFNYLNNIDNAVVQDSNIAFPYALKFTLPSTILQDHGFTKTELSGVYRTGSSWSSAVEQADSNVFTPNATTYRSAIKGFEESQDQAYYLLMGLTLTAKLVDIGESDNGAVFPITATTGQISLRNESKEIATRIIQHMSNDDLYLIRNPANKLAANPEIVQSLLGSAKPGWQTLANTTGAQKQANQIIAFLADNVQTGQWPSVYAYALDNWGNFIKNGQTLPYVWIPASNYNSTPFGISPAIPGSNQVANKLTAYPFTPSFDFRNLISVASAPVFMALMNGGGGPRVDFQGFAHAINGSTDLVYDQVNLVNLAVEASIYGLNRITNWMNGNTQELDSAIAYANATLPPNVASVVVGQINTIKAAKATGIPQLITAGISTGINYIWQIIKQKQQLLFQPILKNVTDERLYLSAVSNPVFYSVDTSCTNAPGGNLVHIGSDQLFGIYFRNILHPLIPNPPAGFRWLNTLAAPSRLLIKNTVLSQLASAPCNGNFNFGATLMPPDPWGSSCTIDRFDATWKKTTCIRDVNKGEYSGLDFMLMHNLYYLTEHPNSSGIIDYTERNLTANFPLSSPISGNAFTQGSNQTFGAFEHIVASNVINANASAIIRAGKSITFLPGFNIVEGADVTVSANTPFGNCDWNTSTGMLRGTASQSEGDNGGTSYLPIKTNNGSTKTAETKKTKKEKPMHIEVEKVQVYPNPNDGIFNVQFNLDKTQKVTLSIYNVLGALVYQKELSTTQDNIPIQLTHVTKGMYLVVARLEDGTLFQKRLMTN